MLAAAMTGILVAMTLALVRAVRGPTVFDRILAANMFGTKTMLLIAVGGFWMGRPEWLDLALVYALVNFGGTIAVLKFVRFGDLATAPSAAPDGDPDEADESGETDGGGAP